MKLPSGPDGTVLFFKIIQKCVIGSNEWTDTSAGGAGHSSSRYPAAKLTLMANGALSKGNVDLATVKSTGSSMKSLVSMATFSIVVIISLLVLV